MDDLMDRLPLITAGRIALGVVCCPSCSSVERAVLRMKPSSYMGPVSRKMDQPTPKDKHPWKLSVIGTVLEFLFL